MLAGFVSMNLRVVQGLGAGGDFLLPWKGARELFFEKAEPYSGQVANFVQQQVYGRDAQPGENPYILKTPAFLLLLYFPLSLFADAGTARAVFLLVSEAGFVVLLLFSLLLADWQPRRFFLAAFFLLSALGLYNLWALMQGSPVLLLALLYAGTLLALRSQRDELAGLLMALIVSSLGDRRRVHDLYSPVGIFSKALAGFDRTLHGRFYFAGPLLFCRCRLGGTLAARQPGGSPMALRLLARFHSERLLAGIRRARWPRGQYSPVGSAGF